MSFPISGVLAPPSLDTGVRSPAATGARVAGPARDLRTCANCHAPLASHFCSECGAPRLEDRPLTVRRFADDAWNEVTSLDSTTTRTLSAFVRTPGRLTREYLEGRTRWFMSPMRLFLLMTAASLLASSTFGLTDRMQEMAKQKMEVQSARRAAARPATAQPAASATPMPGRRPMSAGKRRARRELEQLTRSFPDLMKVVYTSEWLKLLNPLMMAAAMLLIYRRKRRNYAEHVVHALHLHAFAALFALAALPIMLLDDHALDVKSLSTLLSTVVLGRYFYLSTRTVHGDSVVRSVLDTVLLLASMGAAAMMSTALGMLLLMLWRVGPVLAVLMTS